MDMRRYLSEKLSLIPELGEREIMRKTMEQVFLPLYDHKMEKYDGLERRIYEEMPFLPGLYTICATLLPYKNAGDYPWLVPMDGSDLEQGQKSWGTAMEMLKEKHMAILDTVFLKDDYLVCRQIEKSDQRYPACLKIGEQEIAVRVKLKPAVRYREKIRTLYRHFQSNGIPWVTPNIPYCYKMFDVVLPENEIKGDYRPEAPLEIRFEFDGKEGKFQTGFLPVWNVHTIRAGQSAFPMPTPDRINYEYRFQFPDFDESGYLVDLDNPELISMRREKDALVAVSPKKGGLSWDILQILQHIPSETEQFPFPLTSNRQEDGFSERLLLCHGAQIKTRAELARRIHSFDAAKEVRFDSFQLSSQLIAGESYSINDFIEDEIRDSQSLKTMILKFRSAGFPNYLTRDYMSMLVSQVQLAFPEFHCAGVLL